MADHRRRYGEPGPGSALPPLSEPPAWFSTDLLAIWDQTIAAAPPGLLAAIDHANLVAYVAAVDMHQRLMRQAVQRGNLSGDIERRLRLAGAEVGRAAKILGLVPHDRLRLNLSPSPSAPEPQDKDDPWASLRRFPVISGGSKR
jgi:hypothetical protein